jgi:hypothetical protein
VKQAANRTKTAQEYIALIDRVVLSMRRYRTSPVVAVAAPDDAGGPAPDLAGAPAGAGAASDPSLELAARTATPLPYAPTGTFATGAGAAATGGELPDPARAVSLAEVTETIPRRWIVIGGVVLLVLIVGAILLAVTSSGDYKAPAAGSASGAPPPAADREMRLKALLHDLQNADTCAERRAAIAPLVALGDPRAIEPLRAARARTQGAAGPESGNACLVRDADAAIKALTAPGKPAAAAG